MRRGRIVMTHRQFAIVYENVTGNGLKRVMQYNPSMDEIKSTIDKFRGLTFIPCDDLTGFVAVNNIQLLED